jgi:hypothetical protein
MKPVFEAAQEIQEFFDENERQFCFVGGIALQRRANLKIKIKKFK